MYLLTLVVSLPIQRAPSCEKRVNELDYDKWASKFQVGFFYCALYITALGTGGTKPNIFTMGADQFDDFEPKERAEKLSFFNWWMFGIFYGALFSNTFLIYIQDNVGWAVGYSLPTLGLGESIVVFLVGTPYYRHKATSRSPLTSVARVLVAVMRKRKEVVPNDPKRAL
ncbi:Protein NRT1/ PTR FAMILY 5.2 [Camellia lanceoleosa]|uniref:Protein NRT1/ PTR FAMILY 5.2 n=1 Tax=Camellia lanceoleosa TaxID=1840588 RepID=A0ACC0IME7_9ERIC|nr:Protein NRT1/ PTR FAMILY 5.2 [Camellia lanceoleosa]